MTLAKETWKKIAIIRNNCFSHINGDRDVAVMFAQADLTPVEIQEMMAWSKGLLNDVSYVWNGSIHVFDTAARSDTIRLLENLKALSEIPNA